MGLDREHEIPVDIKSRAPGRAAMAAASAAACLLAVFYFKQNYSTGADFHVFLKHFQSNFISVLGTVGISGIGRFFIYAAAAAVYFLSQYALGREISGLLKIKPEEPVLRTAVYSGVGTGVFSLMILLLGLAGALYRPILLVTIATPLVHAVLTRRGREGLAEIPRLAAGHKYSECDFILLLVIFLYLLSGQIGSMSPPSDADALAYHLAAPKLYLAAHRIYFIPHILQSTWPFATEMHYLAALGAGGVVAARMVNFIFMALAALSVAALARAIGGRAAALAAAAVFLSIPIAQGHYFLSNVEPALTFYTLTSISLLVAYSGSGTRATLVACALFAGFAAAVKYTGAAYAAVVFLLLIPTSLRKRRIYPDALIFIAAAAVPVLPWLIRNALWTGNPVWPFFYSIFGGRYWSELHAREYMFYLTHYFGATGIHATLHSLASLFTDAWNRNMGLALVALAPFLMAGRGTIIRGIIPAAAAAAMILIWGITSPQTRFLLPALAVFCALAVAALPQTYRPGKIILTLAISFHLILFAAAAIRHIPYAVGRNMSVRVLSDTTVELYDYLGENSAADARVLLLWNSCGFYSPRDYVVGEPITQAYIDYSEYSNTVALMRRLHEEKITHIVIPSNTLSETVRLDGLIRKEYGLTPKDPTSIYYLARHQTNALRNGWWKKIFVSSDGIYILYEVDYSDFVKNPSH